MVSAGIFIALALGAHAPSAKPLKALKAEAGRLYQQKKFAEASAKFRQALALDSADAQLASDFALCLQKAGKKDSAIALNKRAIRMSMDREDVGESDEADARAMRVRKNSYYNLYKLGVSLGDSFRESHWTRFKESSECGKSAYGYLIRNGSRTNGYMVDGGVVEFQYLLISGKPIPAADSVQCFCDLYPDDSDFTVPMEVDTSRMPLLDTVMLPLGMERSHFHRGRDFCDGSMETDEGGHAQPEDCTPDQNHNTGEGVSRDCALVYLDACHGLAGLACSGSESSYIDDKNTRKPFPLVIQELYFNPPPD